MDTPPKERALKEFLEDDDVRAQLGLAVAAVLANPEAPYVTMWALAELLWERGWHDRDAHEAKTLPPPGGTFDDR